MASVLFVVKVIRTTIPEQWIPNRWFLPSRMIQINLTIVWTTQRPETVVIWHCRLLYCLYQVSAFPEYSSISERENVIDSFLEQNAPQFCGAFVLYMVLPLHIVDFFILKFYRLHLWQISCFNINLCQRNELYVSKNRFLYVSVCIIFFIEI